MAPPTALYIAWYMLSEYEKDTDVKKIVDTFDIIIAPLANPDGYEYTHTNVSLIY